MGHGSGELRRRLSTGTAGVICFLALVYIGPGGRPVWHAGSDPVALPPLESGVVSGVFVALAAAAAAASWRRHVAAGSGWIIATGTVVATQSLVLTLIALESSAPRGPVTIGLLFVAALAGLLYVARTLLLHSTSTAVDDHFAIGLGTGLVAAAYLLLQLPRESPAASPMAGAIGIVLVTHLAATALVLRQRVLSRLLACLLVVTMLVVVVGQLLHAGGFDQAALTVPTTVAQAAVGAAWLSIALVTMLRAIEEDRGRINNFEHVLVSTTRDQRERTHELRSTVAGLISGSELLDRPDLSAEDRQRMWRSVRRELDRMDRLLSGEDQDVAQVDLQEALSLILDLQRLKGRRVELRGNGEVVWTRLDSLAEVVNILLDNAADHGGTDTSVVEVVRHDAASVDITVTDYGRGVSQEQRARIFDWGRRGRASAGEGIGLSLAHRLVEEDGGSLRLSDQAVGCSFVITLPAPRRPTENDPGKR